MTRALLISACLAIALSAHGGPLATMCTNVQELQNTSDGTVFSNECVRKRQVLVATTTSNSTTTFADVTGLTWSAAATTGYNFYCSIIYQSTVATTGIGLTVATTSGASGDILVAYQGTANGAAPAGNMPRYTHEVALNAGTPTTSVPAADTNFQADISGTLTTVLATTASIRLKSEVDTSAVSVRTGSWCIVY